MRIMSDIRAANVEAAATIIDSVFLHTPHLEDASLSRAVGRDVVVKLETINPVRSFKGRGASYFMEQVTPGQRVVTASAGNFGQAIAYAGRRRGIDVAVYCADNANPIKVSRMQALGAHVIQTGPDFDTAKQAARASTAGDPDVVFVEDGDAPRITEGAGTIAIELVQAEPDVIVVPVGNGALATGIGCWIKAHHPAVNVIGVSAAGAPAMARAWRTGNPDPADAADTIADGVAVRVPVPSILPAFRAYVDQMLLVDDATIVEALHLIRDTVGMILEPAGALGVAAMLQHSIPGNRIATIATGSNYSDALLHQLTGR